MKYSNTLIIGASLSGLASAACLKKLGIDYTIIEKGSQIATPWRNHYHRLHLHTDKGISRLPYKKFAGNVPLYPSRLQVVDYLDEYQKEFDIRPVFNTEALLIKRDNMLWTVKTNHTTYQSKYLVIATGPYGKPKPISINGMDHFPGKIMHSYDYKTGQEFKHKKVLIIGFGNSACEIAIDLYEQGAIPLMSVRSPVNVVPRDILKIPITRIGRWLSILPPKLADAITSPLMRIWFGDLTKLGLKKKPYGIFEQIAKYETIPLLDIGTIGHIRQGHIDIYGNLDHIEGNTIYFEDGRKQDVDVIVAAIGYDRNYTDMLKIDKSRFDDLKVPSGRQKYFGKDGLYFCGFFIGPAGQIREIAMDAQKIAKDIFKNEKQAVY